MGGSQTKPQLALAVSLGENALNSEKNVSSENQQRMTLREEISNYVMTSNWYPGISPQTKTQDTKSTSS